MAIGNACGGIFGRLFGFMMLVGFLVCWYVLGQMDDLPDIEDASEIDLNVPLRVFTSDDKLIGEFGVERRIPVLIQDTPSILHDAIIAAEDDNFYNHSGVDYRAIMRAMVSNLKSGGKGQGASTITMQVARNFFLTNDKTYQRKIKEVLLAFRLEKTLSKEQILELYINKIFLGHRSYGFAAAAHTYYGRDLVDLNLPELSMLAGLPKAPSAYNPIRNPKRALIRRNYVLDRMHGLGKIDDLAHEVASKAPITASLHVAKLDMQAPYITELARQYMIGQFGEEQTYSNGYNVHLTVKSDYQRSAQQSLRQGLLNYDLRHGYRGPIINFDLGKVELKDDELSKATQLLRDFPSSQSSRSALVTQVNEKSAIVRLADNTEVKLDWEGIKWAKKFVSTNAVGAEPKSARNVLTVGDVIYVIYNEAEPDAAKLSQMPEVSGALITLDPHTGAILSMVGGVDFYLSKFNRAVQAQRQLGSNIKPFIYAAALEEGLTPASLVSGAPIIVENGAEGIWRPENYSKKFFGPTRLSKALSLSLNLVSVRLLRAIGVGRVQQFLEGFGFNKEKLSDNLSLALGSASVTPLQVVSAYATLANGGLQKRPYLIERISDRDGNYVAKFESKCDICSVLEPENRPFANLNDADKGGRAMSVESNYLIRNMMQRVITEGTGKRALALKRGDLAGKTGTTNDYNDAWFSGFSPQVVTSVWVGYDQPQYLGRRESGAGAALPIWIDHMANVLKDYPEKQIPRPANITVAYINRDTATLAPDGSANGYWEVFKTGSQPVASSVAAGGSNATVNEAETDELF